MASIEKRAGAWRVRWRDPDGSPRSRGGFARRSAAEQFARDVADRVAAGRRGDVDRRPCPTVREAAAAWVKWAAPKDGERGRKASRTIIERGYCIDRFVAAHGDLRADAVTVELLEAWHDTIVERGAGKLYARNEVRGVRGTVNWAATRDDWRGLVPSIGRLDLPPATTDVQPQAPTWAQMDAVIRACGRTWYRRLFVVMRWTGLRSSQVMHLRWDHLDLTAATLEIPPNLVGSKSKHERRGRWLPLAEGLVAELATWGRREGWLIDRTIGPRRGRIDPDARHLNGRTLRRIQRDAGGASETDDQPTHSFRKGFRTNLIADGASDAAVKFFMGRRVDLDSDVYTAWRRLEPLLRRTLALIPPVAEPPAAKVIRLNSSRVPPVSVRKRAFRARGKNAANG